MVKIYSLYIPFNINPGIEILNLTDGSCQSRILGHDFLIKKIADNLHTLTISPFNTTEEARNFLPKSFSYLYWLSLKHGVGLTFPKYLKDDSLEKPVDSSLKSFFEKMRLNVEITGDNTNTVEVQDDAIERGRGYDSVSVSKGIDLEYSKESFEFASPEKVFTQENLTLAIELYSNYHFETTDNARFITLVTVLEALIPVSEVNEFTQDSINLLRKSLKEMQNKYSSEDAEWKDLERLFSRVTTLKNESIGNGMKIYISEIIKEHKELGDSEEISRKLKEIYNYRSKLLHNGKINEEDLKESLQFLIQFIPKLLKVLYIHSVS